MDLLRSAATGGTCICNGVWEPAALRLLAHHCEDVGAFCRDMCRALELGACRGTNMAIIGEPGCGKSMIFEPLDAIFTTMGKPEAKSSFPLSGVLDAHILLWHEYKHKDTIVLFEDLLALSVGERLEIRVPHQVNKSHRNSAPLFYTCNSFLHVARSCPEEMSRLNHAMDERFCSRHWTRPIPTEARIMKIPRCGRCLAKFVLVHR